MQYFTSSPSRTDVQPCGSVSGSFHLRSSLRGRADQIAAFAFAEPVEDLFTHHAPVHHPDPLRLAVACLHRLHDLLDRGHVVAVAGEHLVADREAFPAHDQPDADLLAIRAMIAAVASLRLRVAFRLALEVGRRHVVEHQVVVEVEERAEAVLEVFLQRLLVRQELVQPLVEPGVMDARGCNPDQVLEGRVLVPVLRDVELAGGLAEPRQDQDARDQRPGNDLAPGAQMLLAEIVEPERAPQLPGQPHIAELPTSLHANLAGHDLDGLDGFGRVEQRGRVDLAAEEMASQRRRLRPTLAIELAEVRHHLLAYLAPDAHRANQAPVRVRLAALPFRVTP